MKQILIILIPVILLGIFMAGGFTEDPIKNDFQFAGVFELEEQPPGPSKNVLQIQNLVPKPTALNPTATPTPGSPTLTPTPTPSATGTTCTPSQKVAVDFLLDVSGSMKDEYAVGLTGYPRIRKIESLYNAVFAFGAKIQPDTLVGIQLYSSPGSVNGFCGLSSLAYNDGSCELLSLATHSRSEYNQAISRLSTGAGETYMLNGFQRAKSVIDSKINLPQYNDYTKWFLIFLSDGIPNPPTQEPTSIAAQLKNAYPNKLTIITIGLGDSGTEYDPDLMRALASTPFDFHPAPNAAELESLFNTVAIRACLP